MIHLGDFTIDDYIPIIVQAHDTSGSAADLDSGSFNIDFYEMAFNAGTWAAMTTPDTTMNTKLDSKTGLYASSVQATAANGFEAGKFYAYLIGSGTVDSQTPATVATFRIRADGQRSDEVASRIMTALPSESVSTAANLATVDTVVDAIKAVTDNLPNGGALTDLATAAAIAALNDISAADVNAEVVDALGTDTISELSQGAPPATPTIKTALMLLYMNLRNKNTQTATEAAIYNDDGTKIAKATISDDGTTFTKEEFVSGP